MSDFNREQRLELIEAIQKSRESRLVTYVTGDRQGAPAGQIGRDAVRPMYNHIRTLGFKESSRPARTSMTRLSSWRVLSQRHGWMCSEALSSCITCDRCPLS